jgi:hypothetical protein
MDISTNAEIICPMCGALFLSSEDATISWHAEGKVFNVSMKGLCPPCEFSALPQLVAQSSRCSCGGALEVRDHSLIVKNGSLEFNAMFVCLSCEKAQKKLLSKVINTVKNIWSETTSLEVGVSGVKFGKRPKENGT